LTINIVFILGFIALTAGLYLHYGLAITLITTGCLLLVLALAAVLKPTKIIINKQGA